MIQRRTICCSPRGDRTSRAAGGSCSVPTTAGSAWRRTTWSPTSIAAVTRANPLVEGEEIRRQRPAADPSRRVVVLTSASDDESVLASLRAGADTIAWRDVASARNRYEKAAVPSSESGPARPTLSVLG